MSKGHRDNVKARKARGPVAYAKRAARRVHVPRCQVCGTVCRAHVLNASKVCPTCMARVGED
jgi:rubrerythrin